MQPTKFLTIIRAWGTQFSTLCKFVGLRQREENVWEKIRRWIYRGVPPDTRFRDCQLDLKALGAKPLGNGVSEVCLDGVPYRVYDLRPGIKRYREMKKEEERRGEGFDEFD